MPGLTQWVVYGSSLWLVFFSGCLTGCGLFDSHVKQMDLLRGMATDVTSRLADGSVGQISASGQALNPGVAVEAAVVYRATAKYDGLAGQFSIGAHGVLGPREAGLQPILDIINDKGLSDAKRREYFQVLLNSYLQSKGVSSGVATDSATTDGTVLTPAPSAEKPLTQADIDKLFKQWSEATDPNKGKTTGNP